MYFFRIFGLLFKYEHCLIKKEHLNSQCRLDFSKTYFHFQFQIAMKFNVPFFELFFKLKVYSFDFKTFAKFRFSKLLEKGNSDRLCEAWQVNHSSKHFLNSISAVIFNGAV